MDSGLLVTLVCKWLFVYGYSSITAPQDAYKRLMVQVAEWLTASLYQCSRKVSDMS